MNVVEKNMLHSEIPNTYQQSAWTDNCLEDCVTKMICILLNFKCNQFGKEYAILGNPKPISTKCMNTKLLFMPWKFCDQPDILLNFYCEHCGKEYATFRNPKHIPKKCMNTKLLFMPRNFVTNLIFY